MEMTVMQIDRATVEQALEALEYAQQGRECPSTTRQAITALRDALAQQAEPLNLRDPAIQKRLATQWGYVPAAQAEPVAWNWMLDGLPYGRACYGDPPDADIAERAATAGRTVRLLYTAPSQRKPLTEKEMYIVEEEARKNFRLAQAGPRGQMITYWDSLTPWLIRAVERAHGIKE